MATEVSDRNYTFNQDEEHNLHPRRAMAALWCLLVVVGVIGNALVIYIFVRFKAMRTVTNRYIVNLAITDVTFLIFCVPLTTYFYLNQNWEFGETMCKATIYMSIVTLQATCFTLAAMTVDRYYAICHPLASLRHRRPLVATLVSVAIWALSFPMAAPQAVFTELREFEDGSTACWTNWNKTGDGYFVGGAVAIYTISVSYLIPLLVISLCYGNILITLWNKRDVSSPKKDLKKKFCVVFSPTRLQRASKNSKDANENVEIVNKEGSVEKNEGRFSDDLELKASHRPEAISNSGQATTEDIHKKQRIKVTKMVALVIGLFMMCWAPAHFIHLWMTLDVNFPYSNTAYYLKMGFHTISYFNSVVNPFIYAFMGDNFRKYFIRILRVCDRKGARDASILHAGNRFQRDMASRTLTSSLRHASLRVHQPNVHQPNSGPNRGRGDHRANGAEGRWPITEIIGQTGPRVDGQ